MRATKSQEFERNQCGPFFSFKPGLSLKSSQLNSLIGLNGDPDPTSYILVDPAQNFISTTKVAFSKQFIISLFFSPSLFNLTNNRKIYSTLLTTESKTNLQKHV
jgi:hypothetical protein